MEDSSKNISTLQQPEKETHETQTQNQKNMDPKQTKTWDGPMTEQARNGQTNNSDTNQNTQNQGTQNQNQSNQNQSKQSRDAQHQDSQNPIQTAWNKDAQQDTQGMQANPDSWQQGSSAKTSGSQENDTNKPDVTPQSPDEINYPGKQNVPGVEQPQGDNQGQENQVNSRDQNQRESDVDQASAENSRENNVNGEKGYNEIRENSPINNDKEKEFQL